MTILAGIDIGGTKCAVCLGRFEAKGLEIIGKSRFLTPHGAEQTITMLIASLKELLAEKSISNVDAIGISCGGPLDSHQGLVLSPPNLPDWDRIDVCTPFRTEFQAPTGLQNDANACALAEWRWGAGKGCRNMVFLTFGTGMGAGLILDGRLYAGTNDLAGEVGHVRLEDDGPVGFGKAGSFEGFCSGGGIALLARKIAHEQINKGIKPAFCASLEDVSQITTQKVGEAAQQGDLTALEIFNLVGRKLGQGLALLVDILNPEKIIIGSIYLRQQSLLEPIVLETLRREAIPLALKVCEVLPAGLGESVGDFAGLGVAMYQLES